ncbi:glucose-6-phosphate dehydrogenase [Sphingomonas sp. KR1UV-12]|uniref:Glucose-6-phosphate 1-dehydrogenase n=1 Tax=Sphingomonas aurea TaxID=3063994 RepID=A0ABT9ELN4_9SPHN|nr:glucose-6-phosphate dehydrogenase [Sphingomonas sp. KR1UV-12]MDP1027548.1 glucose-6-phosphate dehydrogenase [Sphingomonas sp. KR1UV-12]
MGQPAMDEQAVGRADPHPQDGVKPAPPVTLVIFGATGDLTRRLLMPALINMTRGGMIDDGLSVLGIGIDEGDDAMLRERIGSFQAEQGGEGAVDKGAAWHALAERIHYLRGDFTADEVFIQLKERLAAAPTGNAAFYLATPSPFFGPIVEKLAQHGLTAQTPDAFRRIAIEKPFGHDLESARALNARILACVDESQVYRIDHFLGKETVQNIMTARFGNTIVESLWNNHYIDRVEITAAETVGIGTRGKFYDSTGALRDMVPNHLFQLLAMVAMEAPNSFDAEAIRNEKGKMLAAIRRYSPEEAAKNAVRGQFVAGTLNGQAMPAYTDVPDVAPDSRMETFVALKLMVDSWRWAGVPFYLRTGKVMTARDTEIVVTFKPVPFTQFGSVAEHQHPPANRMIIQVQPDEGLSMEIVIKRPGLAVDTVPVSLDFRYADRFDIGALTGYESLLYDLLTGDQTLFQRADGIEAGWAAVQPFLDLWAKGGAPEPYEPGSMGPPGAAALIERDGHAWHVSTAGA